MVRFCIQLFQFFRLFAETAHAVQDSISIDDNVLSQLAKCAVDVNNLGIWIDPIGEKVFKLAHICN